MKTVSRRAFLSTTAAASSILVVPRHVIAGAKGAAPSEKVNIAGIGIGGMGKENLKNLAVHNNIVALCDVDSKYAAPVFAQYPNAKTYKDYRVLLEKENIDAVVIATPDHTHAVIAAAAMRAGKHVYCQKPLTHTIHEARKLAEIAKECKVVTQMGIQGHSSRDARRLCEWIAAGVIGEVREVDAWCSLTYYPWGHAYWSSPLGVRPTDTPPVPDTLDWDLWIGPAPMRPYHPTYHPLTWRSWLDFGSSMMGDRGVHTLDPIFWALKLGQPISVEGSSTDINQEVHPIAGIVRFEFPEREGMPPLTLNWYDGVRAPRPRDLPNSEEMGEAEGGVIIKGSKGLLTCGIYGNSPRLLPMEKMKSFTPPPETIPRVNGSHEDDWTRAIKENGKAGADFSYAGPLTEVCLLGNIAKRMNAKLEWDSAAMKVTNVPEANEYIQPPYREGWSLPA